MQVLIVGGGIAGLTLAAFLEQSNIEYELVEKAENWKQQGYLIGLWDNGRDILQKLGLAERSDEIASRIRKYLLRDGKGRLLREYGLEKLYRDYGTALSFFRRPELHGLLLTRINSDNIKLGVTINKLEEGEAGVAVTLSNGEIKTYALVVGADGIHSCVRALVFGKNIEKYENWRTWFTWIDNKYGPPGIVNEYLEPCAFAMTVQSGEKTLVSLCAPADHKIWDVKENRVEQLKLLFRSETLLMPGIFENARAEEITPTDLLEVHLKKWVRGRTVLLGDAAHGYGPHAGLSASMAMEDGYVLAGELMQVNESRTLADALLSYERKRRKRNSVAERASQKMRLFSLTKSKVARNLLNFIIPFVPESLLVRDFNLLLKEEL